MGIMRILRSGTFLMGGLAVVMGIAASFAIGCRVSVERSKEQAQGLGFTVSPTLPANNGGTKGGVLITGLSIPLCYAKFTGYSSLELPEDAGIVFTRKDSGQRIGSYNDPRPDSVKAYIVSHLASCKRPK
jgi:hypothetical protein